MMMPRTLAALVIGALSLVFGCASSILSHADVHAVHQDVLDAHFQQDDWGQRGEDVLSLTDRLEVPEEDLGIPEQGESRSVCTAEH